MSPPGPIRIADITIGSRHRTLDANITPLAADVRRNGIQYPIIVTSAGQLVDGWRRIQAAIRCRIDEIPYVTADEISYIADAIARQPDGEPMRYADTMRYAELLIELDQDAAAARRIAHAAAAGRGQRAPDATRIRANETVARILGISHATFGRCRYVWRRASDHPELVDALNNRFISPNRAYDQVRAADLAAINPPTNPTRRHDPADQHRAIRAAVAQCEGVAHGIRGIGPMTEPPDDADRLAARLIASRTAITQLINNLRKATDHA